MSQVPIDDICLLQNGRAFKTSEWTQEGTPIIRIQNLNDEAKPFNYCDFAVDQKFHVNDGDLLFSWSGTPGTSFGAFFWNRGRGYLNQHIFRVDPKITVSKAYLRLAINSKLDEIISQAHGGVGLKHITKGALKKVKLYLPSVHDQIRIAHLLIKVEGLIAQRKQNLQQLDGLLKSVFVEMFGDPVRNPQKHKISVLGSFIVHLTSGGRGWAKYYSATGKRFIRSLDVQMNAIGSDDIVYVTPPASKESDRTRVEPGDVLLTITGSKIGRVCFVPLGFEEAYISQHVAIIRTQRLNPAYLSYYLSMPNCGQRIINKQQYGQAKPGLNLTQIKNFKILEPDIDLQDHFETIVEKVEGLKSHYQQSLTELENLYGAFSQKAFKGELDLSKVPIHHEVEIHDIVQVQDVVSPTLVVEEGQEMEFTLERFQKIISQELLAKFTFEDLRNAIGDNDFDFNKIKEFMGECLDGAKPFLTQGFESQKNRDPDVKEVMKRITFQVNR